ncbi:response regulator receiver modulated metal dependent phosphohydrolase [Desulfovibrio sp. X2]|uniref:HD domain-containing phosphohydrolase n=1 Tax=Desulfovibrio sp. X2 TaxID=941449 RepID=UPI000358E7BB|nr:HD domain-containing phosphohydrolase [Desulfovibrio sp. X2]EPR37408.1 response regulator receiver modulated metal dependent phosphohydrolase [Desulfovibrio sp. X2]
MIGSRILLVDDEPALVEVCREALADRGHEVLTAGNGRRALPILETGGIDCAVLDMRMPEMGGMDLLREIKRREIDVEVIFLTGYGCIENAVECLQLGAVDYMLKPFNVSDLMARVDKALQERRLRGAAPDGAGLMAVFGLGEALKEKKNFDDLLREFLVRVRGAFAPEGMAFYFADEGPYAGRAPVSCNGTSLAPGLLGWCGALARRLMERNAPKLIDPASLRAVRASGRSLPASLEDMSLLIAPLSNGAHRLGAVVLMRGGSEGAYSVNDLRLLTFLASHASAVLDCTVKHRQIEDISMGVITSFVRAVEAKDPYTCGHSERVGEYAFRLGKACGLGPRDLELLRVAGLLHDVGKIGVPDSVLNKPEGLTDEELGVMRRHPTIGRDIVSRVASLEEVLPIIYHHHERMDGRGYPDGLTGENIPILSRIVSVADGFEAMVSNRAYRHGMAVSDALATLNAGAGTQWDPQVVGAWAGLVAAGGAELAPTA